MLTVRELIEFAEDLAARYEAGEFSESDMEHPVIIAQNPGWPMEYSAGGVQQIKNERRTIVVIDGGEQRGYLPGYIGKELGWQ